VKLKEGSEKMKREEPTTKRLGIAEVYADELMKFIIGEEAKLERTKGKKVKVKPLGVGHLADGKPSHTSKEKKEYSSGN
tara:strand:+ start:748 stop:984 length:237 start_codon:yes stop_codon:yes gene_type:complete